MWIIMMLRQICMSKSVGESDMTWDGVGWISDKLLPQTIGIQDGLDPFKILFGSPISPHGLLSISSPNPP